MRGTDLDTALLDKKIDQMMPELGFSPEDNDRLVASYRRARRAGAACSPVHVCADRMQRLAGLLARGQ